jgi:SAM-dependent methyltransferase
MASGLAVSRSPYAKLPKVDPELHRASTLAAYERLAAVWDEADDNLCNEALERPAVRALLPEALTGARILHAGCASGAHAAWLADHGCVVVAMDRRPAMCAQARTRLAGRGSIAVAGLSATIDDFASAGFSVERIGEPQVDAAAVERFGQEALQLVGRPTFIAYLARRR